MRFSAVVMCLLGTIALPGAAQEPAFEVVSIRPARPAEATIDSVLSSDIVRLVGDQLRATNISAAAQMNRLAKPRSMRSGGYLMRIAMTLLSLALAASACKKKETQPTGDQTGSAPVAPADAAAVVETIRPIQARYAELSADPGETARLLALGADKASAIASKVYTRARDNIGLLPRS